MCLSWCALTAVPSVSRPCGDWCVDGAEAGTLGCVLLYGILNPDYCTVTFQEVILQSSPPKR